MWIAVEGGSHWDMGRRPVSGRNKRRKRRNIFNG
jgi:hypothetical protein